MGISPISLASRSNEQRDTSAGGAKLVNCYVEFLGPDASHPTALYACDGWSDFSTLTSGGVVRGQMLNLDDSLLWCVSGDNLYSVDTGGTATARESTMGLASGEVAYFARNTADTPDIVLVTSEGLIRTIAGTTVSTPSYHVDVGAADFNSVCGHENYFIFTKANSEYFVSGVNATTIDTLDFALGPQGLMRAVVRGRDLVLFGTGSTDFLQNTGGTDFAYDRIHTTQFGLYAAPCAVALTGNIDGTVQDTIIWPATGPDGGYIGVMMLAGYQAQKISNFQLDEAIRGATAANLRAYAYTSQGHSFYTITDAATFSFEYNATTAQGLWHERTGSGLAFAQTIAATEFAGSTLLGDYTSGNLYKLDTTATPAATSSVSVETSRDSGTTWTTARTKGLGTSRTTRTKFASFGQSREDGFQVRLKITSAYVEDGNDIDMTCIPPPISAFPHHVQMHALYVDGTPGVEAGSEQRGMIKLSADIEAVEGV